MLKQIYMPITVKSNIHEAQFIAAGVPEYVGQDRKRREMMTNAIDRAEKELNEALNEGFSLVTQYEVETDRSTSIVFVLHKSDQPTNGK